MNNLLTWTIVIILIIMVGFICLLAGISVGKNILANDKIEQAQQVAVQEFAEQVKQLPVFNLMPSQPDDLIHATIKSISNQTITVASEIRTIDDIIKDQPRELKFKVTPNTKIFYIKINQDIAFSEGLDFNSIAQEMPLALEDLQINDQASIKINPQDKDNPLINALEIKVNR